MATQWSYKLLTYKYGLKGYDFSQVEVDLNELGADGWEAFSTIAPSIGSGHATELSVMLKKPAG